MPAHGPIVVSLTTSGGTTGDEVDVFAIEGQAPLAPVAAGRARAPRRRPRFPGDHPG